MTNWGRFGRAAAAVVVLAVTACNGGDDAEPRALPSLSSSAEASPSPTASMTVEQEVEAAARQYLAEVDRAIHTGDTAQLAALSTTECPCRELVRFIDEEWRKGAVQGAVMKVHRVTIREASEAAAIASVDWELSPSRTVTTSGATVSEYPVNKVRDDLIFNRRADRDWVLVNVVNLGTATS